jgi:hypothetical protein
VSTFFSAEQPQSRRMVLETWPVNITSYKLGDEFHCVVDNVDPGAAIARGSGSTRELAESSALEIASSRLSATRRMKRALDSAREAAAKVAETLKK